MKRFLGKMEYDNSDGKELRQRVLSVMVEMSINMRAITVVEQGLISERTYPVGNVHVGLFHDFPVTPMPGMRSGYLLFRGLRTVSEDDVPNLYELTRMAAYPDHLRPTFRVQLAAANGQRTDLGMWWVFSGRFIMGNVDFDMALKVGPQDNEGAILKMVPNLSPNGNGSGGIDA